MAYKTQVTLSKLTKEDKITFVNPVEYREKFDRTNINSRISDDRLLQTQKDVLRDYIQYSEHALQRKISTIKRLIYQLTEFALFIKKDFNKVDKDDIYNFLEYAEHKKNMNSTKNLKIATIKTFYKWLNGGNEPVFTKMFKTRIKTRVLKENELITREEAVKLVNACETVMGKALLMMYIETAGCAMEVLNAKIKDFKDIEDEERGKLYVVGKTDYRTRHLPIIDSYPYVKDWLNQHKFRDNPDAPLFYSKYQSKGEIIHLHYTSLWYIIKRAKKITGINKRLTAHLMRHSALTHYAKEEGFNEMDLRILAGWERSSKMAEIYVNYGEEAVENKLLKNRGRAKDDKSVKTLTEQKKCSECNKRLPVTAKYCSCGATLNDKAKAERLLSTIINNPKVLEAIKNALIEDKIK